MVWGEGENFLFKKEPNFWVLTDEYQTKKKKKNFFFFKKLKLI